MSLLLNAAVITFAQSERQITIKIWFCLEHARSISISA